MNDFIFGMVAAYIRKSIKNPDRKRKLRIYKALKSAFADDPEFD